jgi:hypothetical protein
MPYRDTARETIPPRIKFIPVNKEKTADTGYRDIKDAVTLTFSS